MTWRIAGYVAASRERRPLGRHPDPLVRDRPAIALRVIAAGVVAEVALDRGGHGLRAGEVSGLQWQDLDLAAGTILLRETGTSSR
jgi:integrase